MRPMDPNTQCTAFTGTVRLTQGPLWQVAPQALAAQALVFDDTTGRIIDLDPRAWDGTPPPARRGRPKLGVTAREVTLLPRHWDWLAQQKGGISAALRRLIDEARRADGGRTAQRQAQEAAYRVMTTLGGDLPGYEEATRALFAGDLSALADRLSAWPDAVRAYVCALAMPKEDT